MFSTESSNANVGRTRLNQAMRDEGAQEVRFQSGFEGTKIVG
jgi:hypothetical protein